MKELDNEIFISLFREAYRKCFGFPLVKVLSESECKHFSNKILEDTGLVIGAKSIKNYAGYVVSPLESKQENPSVATLDTLARYVLSAPYTDEVTRKNKESHHPYWFTYKSNFVPAATSQIITKNNPEGANRRIKTKTAWLLLTVLIVVIAVIVAAQFYFTGSNEIFTDDFHAVQDDSLNNNGWFLQAKDALWWSRRDEEKSHLTLYTLPGDSWADSAHAPVIKNLLLRKISSDCFTAEIHLDDFIPLRRWQQAGIILMEDTAFAGKSLRLSLAFNDFFGGFDKPKEIIIQAISSNAVDFTKPEEIAHYTLFSITPGQEKLVTNNLQKSALKIEKNNNHFRFLSATGVAENFAYKEVLSKDILIKPKYIGIFALGGFVNDTSYIPAHFKFFSIVNTPCDK